jgi:hypothetical protein
MNYPGGYCYSATMSTQALQLSAKLLIIDYSLVQIIKLVLARVAVPRLLRNCWLMATWKAKAGSLDWRIVACPWNCLVSQPMTLVRRCSSSNQERFATYTNRGDKDLGLVRHCMAS